MVALADLAASMTGAAVPLVALATLLLASGGHAQRHDGGRQHHGSHHSWDFLYEDMCGCTETKHEGCGLSSRQLFKTLNDSYGVRYCEKRAAGQGDEISDAAAAARVERECEARLKLKEVASEFAACYDMDQRECEQTSENCQWDAQDINKCGIDEERLLAKLLGQELRNHPLMRNVLALDRCSAYNYQGCIADEQCTYRRGQGCTIHSAIAFNSFVEHPALFEVLEFGSRGARCRGWHEHVWHGDVCWQQECHLEGELCTSNVAPIEQAKANATIVSQLRDRLCWQMYRETAACQQGCHWIEEKKVCQADKIEETANLEITEDDIKVAYYYMAMRSATYIHEIRCNSLDNDIQQCKKTAEEHIDCTGMFHVNSTEVFANWQRSGKGGQRQRGSTPTPAENKEAQTGVMQNAIANVAKPDAGVGLNGPLNDIVENATSDREGLFANFDSWLQKPETKQGISQLQAKLPDAVQGLVQILPHPSPATADEAVAAKESTSVSVHIAAVAAACMVLAGVCGGFAWGVICANRGGSRRFDNRPLLDAQGHYVRHPEIEGATNI